TQLAVRGRFGDLGTERMRGVRPEHPDVRGEEGELLQGERERGVLGMALDVRVELRGEERAAELIALELRHVDAVRGEAAHRLVEGRRYVAHPEDEAGDHLALAEGGL